MARRQNPFQTSTKDSIAWIKNSDELPNGPLPSHVIEKLAKKHQIDDTLLLELSRKLRCIVKDELHLAQPELLDGRRDVGSKKINRFNDLLHMAEKNLEAASSILTELDFRHPYAHTGMPNPSYEAKENFQSASEALAKCKEYFRVSAANGWAIYCGAPDKREVVDVRRKIVCTAAFNLWDSLGRNLTFTTDPIRDERIGALIDFVQDVVQLGLTDPPRRPKGETIMRDLKEYLKLRWPSN